MERKRVASPFALPLIVERALARLIPGWPETRLCVALSGGVDSTVLLHAAAALARTQPRLRLRAAHVDHGLQPDSPGWARSCETLCRELRVPLSVLRLDLRPPRGASVEAEARRQRYAALTVGLAPGEWLLTAHHRQDQLETLLLQLFRGAGVAGLAAMPAAAPLGTGHHGRPLLEVDRSEIEAYARAEGLAWIADPMNDLERFDRAWLRRQGLPALLKRWPALPATVARSARHLAVAQHLLESLAELDARGLIDAGRVEIQGLLRLPPERQSNVLRWWLASEGLPMPSEKRLCAIREGLIGARIDAMPVVRWGGAEVRRYRSRLYALRQGPPDTLVVGTTLAAGAGVELGVGLGRLELEQVPGSGLSAARVGAQLEIRYRTGGEELRPMAGRPRRSLRNLFQEGGVVPWMRARMPLLYAGTTLIAVADLWLDADVAATAGEMGLQPRWLGRPPLY